MGTRGKRRRFAWFWPRGALLAASGISSMGCDVGGGGGGGGGVVVKEGQACTAADHDSDVEVCGAGTVLLECKGDAAGTSYFWEVEKDCADSGRICRLGSCVERTTPRSPAARTSAAPGPSSSTASPV